MEFEFEHFTVSTHPEVEIAVSLVLGGIYKLDERSVLNEYELGKYQQQIPVVRASFLLGRYTAKTALIKLKPGINFTQINISNGVWGFPVINCNDIKNVQVSISHTDDSAAAVCFPEQYPMGIDIEKISESNMMIIKAELTQEELLLAHHFDFPIEHFCLSLWTAKEALAKALKTGFRVPFNFFEIAKLVKYEHFHLIKFKHFRQFEGICVTIGEMKMSLVYPVELDGVVKNVMMAIRTKKK